MGAVCLGFCRALGRCGCCLYYEGRYFVSLFLFFLVPRSSPPLVDVGVDVFPRFAGLFECCCCGGGGGGRHHRHHFSVLVWTDSLPWDKDCTCTCTYDSIPCQISLHVYLANAFQCHRIQTWALEEARRRLEAEGFYDESK